LKLNRLEWIKDDEKEEDSSKERVKNCGCDNDISYAVTVIDINKYLTLGAPHFLLMKNEEDNKKELLGLGFCSNCGPFPYLCNNDDSEST